MKSLTQRYAEAMQKAKRRRSLWNLVLVVIKWPLALLWWVLLLKIVLWIPHGGSLTFREAAKHDGPMSFIAFPLLILSFLLAMITANYLLFLIPHARRTFEAEAGKNPQLKFINSQKAMAKIAFVVAVIALPVALAASWWIKA